MLVSLFAVWTIFAWQLCLLSLSVFRSSVSVLVFPYRSACVTVCCCRSLVYAVFLFSQVVLLSPLGCSSACVTVRCYRRFLLDQLSLLWSSPRHVFGLLPLNAAIPVFIGSRFLLVAFPHPFCVHSGTVSFCAPVIVASFVCSCLVATCVFCDVFLLYTLSISLLRCSCSCSMPPARATRGRPSRQASSVRQTRSRARAVPVDPDSDYAAPSVTVPPSSPPFVDTLPFQPVSFGRPPPQCDELQDFDTAPGLRAVVTDSALARSAWERDMERRVVSSERMLGEIPNLVLNLRPNPAVAAISAALGSAVQSVSVDMPPGEGRHAVPPVTAPAGHALPPFPDAPWPLVDTFFPGTAVPPLSNDTQTLLSSCTSTALPLDAQIHD